MSESRRAGATLPPRTAGTVSRRTLFTGGSVLVAAGPAAAGATPPDAELIRLCTEMVALDRRLNEITREMGSMVDGPEEERLYAEGSALVPSLHALADRIARTPAFTLEGWKARATAAQHDLAGDADEDDRPMDPEDALVWSLLEDLRRGG